jgi:DNA invertase Pin-like site-specific DNA recombinase
MIACYCRVSSRDQKHDSQKAEITRWLRNHRISLRQVQWFIDKESGSTLKRPAFDQLQKAIFDGTVKTVVVWKLDLCPAANMKASASWQNGARKACGLSPSRSKLT